jgi:hypothetical protein
MGRMKPAILGACAVLAVVAATAGVLGAQGTPADRTTYVTISGPVSLPGVTLPAGEYLFRLADTQASRSVVQIFNRDRTKIFATILAIPAERTEVSDEAVITFKEAPSNRPPAVHFWYYAGEKSGQEFAYPKAQAMQIASASGESVLAIDTTSSDVDAMKSGEITRIEPSAAASQQPATPAAAAPATASPEPQAPAQPEPQAPASPAPSTQPSSTAAAPEATTPATSDRTRSTAQPQPQPTGTSGELPRTASELPLVGLVAFLALGGAFAARALRRRLIV